MKSISKIFGYTAIALIFCIALSGCTSTKSTSRQKIVIWGFESQDAWKTLINQYSTKNKNIDFVYQQQTLDANYENRYLNSILSGNGPDILAMPNETIYRHKDKLAPMPDAQAAKINLDNLFVSAVKQSTFFNQKIYAMTPTAEPLMIYFNPKMMTELQNKFYNNNQSREEITKVNLLTDTMPKTWTDWIELAKYLTVKDTTGNITQAGAAIGTDKVLNSQDILYLLMMQNQTQIISDNLKLATFNLPKDTPPAETDYPGRRAMDFYTSFSNSKSDNYIWNDSLGNSLDAFVSGKVAMVFGYSNFQNYLEQKYPEFVYKKAFVPQQSQDADKIVDYAKFNAFAVSKLSANTPLCWLMVQDIAQNNYIDIPSSSNLYTSAKSNNLNTSILDRESNNPERIELASAKSLVRGRYPTEFDQNVRGAIASVNSGSQTSAAALDTAAEIITTYLNKATW
ncbi:MAG: extracellular solute-binding protein [Candidatus Berkelbacteria bacterium]